MSYKPWVSIAARRYNVDRNPLSGPELRPVDTRFGFHRYQAGFVARRALVLSASISTVRLCTCPPFVIAAPSRPPPAAFARCRPCGCLRLSRGTRDPRQQAGEHQPHRHLRIDAGTAWPLNRRRVLRPGAVRLAPSRPAGPHPRSSVHRYGRRRVARDREAARRSSPPHSLR